MRKTIVAMALILAIGAAVALADKVVIIKTATAAEVLNINFNRLGGGLCKIQYEYRLKDSVGGVVATKTRIFLASGACPTGVETWITNNIVPDLNAAEGL